MAGFASAVRGLRERAGFPSARSFYKSRGGPRGLGCTYRAYLNVEAGRSLPQPKLAMSIARGLGLASDGAPARDYCLAYLRSTCRSEELSSFLERALSD